jgi:hypothetical protein
VDKDLNQRKRIPSSSQGFVAEEQCLRRDSPQKRMSLQGFAAEEDVFAGLRRRRGCFHGIVAEWRIMGDRRRSGFLGYQCRRGNEFPDHIRFPLGSTCI